MLFRSLRANSVRNDRNTAQKAAVKHNEVNAIEEETSPVWSRLHKTLNAPDIEEIKKELSSKKENISKLNDILDRHEKTQEIKQKAAKGEISSEELEKHLRENPPMHPQTIKQLKGVRDQILNATPESVAKETEKVGSLTKMTLPGLALGVTSGFKTIGAAHAPQAALDTAAYAAGRFGGWLVGKGLEKFGIFKPGTREPYSTETPTAPAVTPAKPAKPAPAGAPATTPAVTPPTVPAKPAPAGAPADRKSTRLNSSHMSESRMPSSA